MAPPQPGSTLNRGKALLFGALGLVVVVVLAVVLVNVLGKDDKPTDPHGIAEGVAAAMAKPAPSDLGQYYCSDQTPQDQRPENVTYDPGEFTVGTEKRLSGDISFVQVISAKNPNSRYAVYFVTRQGNWCVGAVLVCGKTADGGYLATVPMMCHEIYPDVPAY